MANTPIPGRQALSYVNSAGDVQDVGRVSPPHATTVTIVAATTNATGSSWTAFSSQACDALDLLNNTGVTIEYRRGAAGTAMQVPTGTSRLIIGITNASAIDVRRVDQSNTQVAVQAEALVH